MDSHRWERRSWVVFVGLVVATTLAIAKTPLMPDTNPVVERFSGPQFLVLTLLATIALVAWVIAWIRGELRPRLGLAHALLVCFLAAATLSSLLSAVVPLALIGESGRYMGVATWVFTSVAFFLASQLVNSASRLRTLSRAVILTGTAEAVIGLSQLFGLDPLRLAFPEQYSWMLAQGVGTLGNPNHLAAVLVIPFVLACAECALAQDVRWRVVSALSAVVMGLSLVASATRAAWVGALAGFLMLVVVGWLKKRLTGRQVAIATVVLACVVLVGALISDQAILRTRFVPPDPSAPAADQLASGRLMLWSQSLDVFSTAPLIGVGADSLRNAWKAAGLSSGQIGVFTDDPHSLPLLLLTSFGILGSATFGGFLAGVLPRPLRRLAPAESVASASALRSGAWLVATVALLLTSLVSVLCIPMVLLLMTALGVVHAPHSAASRSDRDTPLPVRVGALVSVTALGVSGLLASGIPFYHNLRITAADLGVPMSQESVAVLDAADRALPWRYEMMTRRATRLAEQGLYEASVADDGPGRGRQRLQSLLSDLDLRAEKYDADYYAWLNRARTYAIVADGLRDEALHLQASQIAEDALERFPNDLELQEISGFLQAR